MRGSPELQVLTITVCGLLFIDLVGRHDFSLPQPWGQFVSLEWWVASCVLVFWLIPALWLKRGGKSWLLYAQPPKKSGHLLLYPAMYAVMLPLLLHLAPDPRFQATYPFFKYAREFPTLGILWELSYALMFCTLEFFFRGFLIGELRKRWGYRAVLLSAIPYFLIHYNKPFPEMLGSLPAGVALGTLSYFTGSIWGGVFAHLAVAFTMDALQLWGG